MAYAGELSALLTATLWTGSALAFAAATARIGSVYVNVSRLVFALPLLFLTILALGIRPDISTVQITYLALSGFVGFVFGDTFLFKSYEYNSARIGSLVMSASPAFTALLAFFLLGEALTATGIAGMGITLGGIALVILERKETSSHTIPISTPGICYAFLGALGQAGGLILAKRAFEIGPINGVLATFIRVLAATTVVAPLNYFAGRLAKPFRVLARDRNALKLTILGAFLGPFLGVVFSLISISRTDVAVAATLMATSPILMLPTVRVLFKEKLSWRAVFGAAIAVIGVGVLFLR
jgi:drug/metabolite transporter (DMT)-like permease